MCFSFSAASLRRRGLAGTSRGAIQCRAPWSGARWNGLRPTERIGARCEGDACSCTGGVAHLLRTVGTEARRAPLRGSPEMADRLLVQ